MGGFKRVLKTATTEEGLPPRNMKRGLASAVPGPLARNSKGGRVEARKKIMLEID